MNINPDTIYNSKEKMNKINLSNADKEEIKKITLGIESVDNSILELAVEDEDVIKTLSNGNELNKLIYNSENELSGYIACEDFIPQEAYIKYFGTNNKIGRNLIKEIPAFLEYAKEKGYTKLNFHGWNNRLNHILTRYGFEKIRTDNMEDFNVDFYEKNLTEVKSKENITEERRQAFENKYISKLKKDKEKIILTYGKNSKEKLELLKEAFSALDSKLKNNQNFNYNERQKALLELKLARYLQNNDSIDNNTLYDAIIETPKFLNNDKGSFHRLFEIHQQKIVEKIAENRKKRAEMTDNEELNPYESLFETDSGKYYMARLLNMPHLEEESEYMKNCVGTSNSYINKIKRGDIEILSFRNTPTINKETNKLEGDTPIITIEYNLKTKVIEQMKEYDDTFLSKDDPFYNDIIEALTKLRTTKTDKEETRDFSHINNSELVNINIKENHILTNKSEVSIEDYDEKDKEQFILKAERFEVNEDTTKELFTKACQIPGLNISIESLTIAQQFLDGSIEKIKGDLNLSDLTSAEGLTLPESIGGYLDLRNLTSAEGLTLPESIGGYLDLRNLTSAEGLTLPKSIGGYLNLYNLTSAEGLTLPKSIGGGLYLYNLTSAEGLTLPKSIGGNLNLRNLTSAEGLTLPESIGGYLNLYNLTSAEGLTLPESIGGGLYLDNLTSAEGLTLPKSIGGNLNLRSLTSVEGLVFPKEIGGALDLFSLPESEKQKLREKYPQYAEKI